MLGQQFGRLTVLCGDDPHVCPSGAKHPKWICRCDCGSQISVLQTNLRKGNTRSCGCDRVKHGHALPGKRTSTYGIWSKMIQRCENADDPKFNMYGGRGITVCDRWNKFENFLADMGERPEGKSIDREDNSRGYVPGNCRWATRKEQQRNMRSNRFVEYGGRKVSVAELAEILGQPYSTVRAKVASGSLPL